MGRLFWKIFLGFWLTLLLVGSAVGGLVWLHNIDRIKHLELLVDNPRADRGIANIANILQYGGEAAVREMAEHRYQRRGRPLPIMIIDEEGDDLLGRPVPFLMLDKARKALSENNSSIQQVTSSEGRQYILFIPRHDHPAMQNPFFGHRSSFFPLLVPFLASLIFSAGLAWYITRPLRILSEASQQFADGQLDTRVSAKMGSRKDEIADLGDDFDYMAQRIQHLIAAQRRLLNDVSHELRSPLARLQVAVELSRQQPERSSELVQRIEKESVRLDELVGELLRLSKLESIVPQQEKDFFDITGLISSIADDANFEYADLNKEVQLQSQQEINFHGHIELLRRAIENIVRNALHHSPNHSQVNISLDQSSEHIIIKICDQGDGVPESKLNELFQPFVRIDETNQNSQIPGYGLGLAIAKRAVELHEGVIRAYNHSNGGLCIEIRLPLNH